MIKKAVTVTAAAVMLLAAAGGQAPFESLMPVQVQSMAATVKEPGKVTGVKALACMPTSIKLTWNKVPDADGYVICLKETGGYKLIGRVDGNNVYTATGLLPSWRRHFIIRAFKKKPEGGYVFGPLSDQFFIATCPEAGKNLRVYSSTYNSMIVAWDHVSCNDYVVYQMKGSSWVRLGTTTRQWMQVKGLSPSTAYKFVIRPRKLDDNGYEHLGGLSNVLTAKTPRNTITVKNGITYVNDVLIANKTYSLPAGYDPGGLTNEAYNAFIRMRNAASADGISLWICSGYRSYYYQRDLYNNYVYRDGRTLADTYSARPGHSEHQTGLAMDINYANDWFEQTPAASWLARNCWKYGFIIRYPKGKQSITGFKYEPWHIRYLGTDLAKKVTASGLCLEEYLGITSRYDY